MLHMSSVTLLPSVCYILLKSRASCSTPNACLIEGWQLPYAVPQAFCSITW